MSDNVMERRDTVKTAPWLTIVIPIYNAEKYLTKCLDSIIGQTFSDYEVLLVDDGSTDASSVICREYVSSDSRFHYLKKENGGAYQTRIFGAERAAGTYVMFCDADDYYANRNVFSKLQKELSERSCQALQFGYVKKYNHLTNKCVSVNEPLDMDADGFCAQEYPKLLCSFWKTSHLTTNVSTKVFHRELLANLPPSDSTERVFWGDDLILNLHLLFTCKSFRFIPDTLYVYRQFSGGTSRFSTSTMRDLDTIKKHQLTYLERYQGESKESIRDVLFSEIAGWFFIYVQQALDHLNEDELRTLINDSLSQNSFVMAREYYLNKTEDHAEEVELLRRADASEYIAKAKQRHDNRSVKDSIRKVLKTIYTNL